MADNRATLKASIKTALANAVGVDDGFDTLAGDLADAYAVWGLAMKGRADVAGPTPMLDSVAGPVTGTTTME